MWRSWLSTPVWLVSTPTRLPFSSLSYSSGRSTPSLTLAFGHAFSVTAVLLFPFVPPAGAEGAGFSPQPESPNNSAHSAILTHFFIAFHSCSHTTLFLLITCG